MTYSFRPARRENTPIIVGIAGPTKSGKTYSAHRLARGLARGGVVAMINAEGARGHQYADKFEYMALDLSPPFSPESYIAALAAVRELKPAVLIIDSMSHMHDGPGGLLELHDSELDRMAGDDFKKRERMTWTAWIRPKKEENEFIYALLALNCATILCFRAKEKIKIVPGKQPIDLGWQPIASDRIAFETLFTLMLPPHSKGVPDMETSEFRDPFDKMLAPGKPLDEELGDKLTAWAAGQSIAASTTNWDEAIAAATTEDLMRAVKAGLNVVRSSMSSAERERLRKLIVAKEATFAGETMTEEQVQAMIDSATDVDTLDMAAGNIAAVADEAARARLDVNARAKKRTLAP